jgi:hypothetical protein
LFKAAADSRKASFWIVRYLGLRPDNHHEEQENSAKHRSISWDPKLNYSWILIRAVAVTLAQC